VKKTTTNPYGNLSFTEYTFDTPVERLVVALQASLVVSGHPVKSPTGKKLQRLKRALKKDKRYSFSVVHREVEEGDRPVFCPDVSGPASDMSEALASATSKCLGIPVKKVGSRDTSAGYAVVSVVCVGSISDLKVPLHTTAEWLNPLVLAQCSDLSWFKPGTRVVSASIKTSKKKKYCRATLEIIYK